jgi:hypothetical protein
LVAGTGVAVGGTGVSVGAFWVRPAIKVPATWVPTAFRVACWSTVGTVAVAETWPEVACGFGTVVGAVVAVEQPVSMATILITAASLKIIFW